MGPDHGKRVLRPTPAPPVYVVDGLDVGVFKSIEEAVESVQRLGWRQRDCR